MRQRTSLFDHLVCELQEGLGDAEPKRFCGLEVDDKLKLDWRLRGECGRVLALQDTINIRGCPSKNISDIGPIRHQTPFRNELPKVVHRGDVVCFRQSYDDVTLNTIERVCGCDQSATRILTEVDDSRFDLCGTANRRR